MKNHLELSDEAFMKEFIECTLPADLFNHEAHVRLAWININQSGVSEAMDLTSDQIKNYASSIGEAGIYHNTLTRASVRVVYHFILKDAGNNFSDFIAAHPRLNTQFKDLLQSHYSIDLLWSDEAKKAYLEPDLLPFDPFPSMQD